MKPWYKSSYRRNLVDMHIPDWNEDFLSEFKPENYAEMLELAQVDTAIIYASSCLGISYWPTKVGHSHASMRGRDFLTETITACKKKNLNIVVYYNIWSTWAYNEHPEWRMRAPNGETSCDSRGSRFGVCCPSAPGFTAYVLAQIDELLDNYEMVGMWIDMIGGQGLPNACCCDNCKKRYREETGVEIPKILDWYSPEWTRFQRKREEWQSLFTSQIRERVKSKNPNYSVTFQTSIWKWNWSGAASLDFFKQSDYLAGDFNYSLLMQSFVCKFFNNLTENRPIEYMAPRCVTLKEHTTNKSDDFLLLNAFASFANNASFVFIDAIDPKGTLDPELYKKFGSWFRDMSKYEKYLDHNAETLADVAIYFNFESTINPELNGTDIKELKNEPYYGYEKIFNITKTLIDQNISFDIITNKNLDMLDRFQVLVLPDICVMAEDEATAIRKYAAEGGTVFATGKTSLLDRNGTKRDDFLLADLFGASFKSFTKEWKTYLAPCPDYKHLFPDCSKRYPLSMNEKQVIVSASDKAAVIAKTILPYLDPDDDSCYSTAIADPPMISTELPCCVMNQYGKGKSLYCAGGIDGMTFDKHRKVLESLLRHLCKKPLKFETNAPKPVEITVQHHPDHHRLIISIVNFQEELPNIPVHNLWIKLNLNGLSPKTFLKLPDETEYPYEKEDDFIRFELPVLNDFAMFALSYIKNI